MAYLVLATFLFCLTGYPVFLDSLGMNFPYRVRPSSLNTLSASLVLTVPLLPIPLLPFLAL